MVKKRIAAETSSEAEQVIISSEEAQTLETPDETNPEFEMLLEAAHEIRQDRSVLGYILRSEANATVDLNEPDRIVEYGMFTSQALESSQTLASLFNAGDVKTVLVECKQAKVFCIIKGEYKLVLFLEKYADHAGILAMLQDQQLLS
jgi:predicted regulator of Ras-like GTPase activity (Roadblock/LC7/MglB family)